MIVLDHFAAFTRLPIKINDIADFILERGFVNRITFHGLDESPDICAGLMIKRRDRIPYAIGDVADIAFSVRMPVPVQRLVLAKELIHVCEVDGICAATKAQVGKLVEEIGIPLTALIEIAKLSKQLVTDHSGLLLSIAMLIPRDARVILKRLLDQGVMGLPEIAALARVPESFAGLAMKDGWENVLNFVCPD